MVVQVDAGKDGPARVALVTPPLPDSAIAPMPQLGPSVLRGDLEARGHSVELIDLGVRVRWRNRFRWRRAIDLGAIYGPPERLRAHLDGRYDPDIAAQTEALIRLGDLDRYDLIGFSLCLDSAIAPMLCLAERLKRGPRPPTIVAGGPIFERSDFRSLLEFDCVDAIVNGDGEPAMRALLEGAPLEGTDEPVPGLEHLGPDGASILSAPASVPLAEKAAPVFEPADVARYRALGQKGGAWLPYLLTRGCRYRCSFCRDYSNVRFTYTPTQKVLDDVGRLIRDHGVDSIYFGESNINNDPDAIREMCEAILRRGPRFRWGGLGTISGLDEETIDLMARAGCRYLSIGIETASEALREKWNIGKCRDLGQIERRLARMHELGIRVNGLFIVAFPHETEADYEDNLEFLSEVAPYFTTVGASEFDLIEGSPAHMRPATFSLRPREAGAGSGRYAFLDRYVPFDEVGGMRWEDKQDQGRRRLRRFERLARLKVGLPLALRMWRDDPLYPLRRAARRPYFDYDVYL